MTAAETTEKTTRVSSEKLPIADAGEVRAELARALRGQGVRTAAVVTTMAVGAALGLVAPWALGRMVDTIIEGGTARDIAMLGLLMLAAAGAFAASTALGVVLSSRLFETMLARLREQMFSSSIGLELERVERAGSGDLISRATDDVDEVSSAIATVVPALSTSLFTVVLTAVGLTALDWRFLAAIVLVLPVYALAVRWYLRNAPGIYTSERAAMGLRAHQVLGAVRGLRTVHEFDLAPTLSTRISTHSWEVVRWSMRARIVQNRFYGRLNTAQFLAMAALLVIGYVLVGSDAVTVGATTTAMLFFLRVFEPIENLLLVIDELQSALASLARIVGVIGVGDGVGDEPLADTTISGAPVLSASSITFGYSSDRIVLSDIDFRLEPGETVALVGTSGAGKSTLAAVLAGVRTPTRGRVQLGGVDLADIPDHRRARHITLVTQDVHVFTGTLRDDLALADPRSDDTRKEAALRTVLAGDWFDLLPDGLDTLVGDAGHPLTPLQAQQLALARLVLVDPPVAVLDEATAEAGSAGAFVLERSARAALAGRSALIVAHRLEQARRADRILLMDNGHIVEEGTHETLVARGGRYARLWAAWNRHR